MTRVAAFLLLFAATAVAQPKRVLYFSRTAGFRHASIATARDVLTSLDPQRWQVTASEDLTLLTAARLRDFDAVFFFTSGELAIDNTQKQDLLDYVRNGGGFAAVHSASDTFYTWPEYGELIGAYFDGHPWTQRVSIDVEDPEHTVTRGLPPSFSITDEIYQHRAFDRSRVRVILTLDTRTVDLRAEGVNRTDNDFALAWVRSYGRGRVFYSALGHLDEVWQDANNQRILRQALSWITGLAEAETTPRSASPLVTSVTEAAQYGFNGVIAPGSWMTIFGTQLTSGSTLTAPDAVRLAGTSVLLNGNAQPLLYAAPNQLNFRLPDELPANPELIVRAGIVNSSPIPVRIAAATPGIFAVTVDRGVTILWATGLGALDETGRTRLTPRITQNGADLEVLYSGRAPGFPGLYQVNLRQADPTQSIRLEIGGVAAQYIR